MTEKTDQWLTDLIHGAMFTGDWSAVITAYIHEADKGGPGESFYLTQAYTYALDANDPIVPTLRARLIALKAETEDPD